MKVKTQKLENLTCHKLEKFNRVAFEFGEARLVVTALNSKILRLHYSFTGEFMPRRSWAVAREDGEFEGAPLLITERLEGLELATDQLSLLVRRADGGVKLRTVAGRLLMQDAPEQGPICKADGSLLSLKTLPPDEYYYGFGERSGLLEKRGRRYTCWNCDPGDTNFDHGPGADQLHLSIPFFMALRPQKGGYGLFFNNTFKTVFDAGHTQPDFLSMEAYGGELDYYLFYGPDPANIVECYTELTGRTPLPPRWALGYHQSRWGYYPETKVREIVTTFRNRKIPLDAIHLDIDYMDDYRVFTWNKAHFSDPGKLIEELKALGVKVVTIIDPGVKYDPDNHYPVYEEGVENDYFIRGVDGDLFHGYVWPGDTVFPDFAKQDVRKWWGDLHRSLSELGVLGIWNDMNEPALVSAPFGTPGKLVDIPGNAPQGDPAERTSHAEVHNVYGLLENISSYEGMRRLQPERRPFNLTRAGFAAIQKWAAVWTGDNLAIWEHLEMAMAQLCNMGLSGVSFAGTDIGGFHWHSNGELWARWIELGVFFPFSRGHSINSVRQKEPWVWGERIEKIARQYIELRYQLLPYLYTLFEESSRKGSPILRPLLYEFYTDPQTLELSDQVMLGSGLLLAPVYRPGVQYRHVYLPGGHWYDFWSGKLIREEHILAYAPLEVLPLYVRAGTVLPVGPVMQYSEERPLDRLTLEIYLDQQGAASGRLYEDDGESFAYTQGESCTTTYTVATDEASRIHLWANREGHFQTPARPIEIRLHSSTGIRTYQLPEDMGNWDLVLDPIPFN